MAVPRLMRQKCSEDGWPVTVEEIVAEYLKANGYDGLYEDGECSCQIGDIAPCDESFGDCKAGYKVPGCTDDCSSGCEYHIGLRE